MNRISIDRVDHRNIILLGLRCSGKSTVGRLLAARLSRPLVDLDELTVRELDAASVTDAWQSAGQTAFREAEWRLLAEVLAHDGQIIALGGGTPTAPGAAELLREAKQKHRDLLFYLRADPEMLRIRLSAADAAADRPPVMGESAAAEVEALFQQRDPLYSKLANHILDGGQTPQALADAVASIIRA